MTDRLPDFVIVGAAKCATTSLFRWLAQQPECSMPSIMEPNFFCDDDVWSRGVTSYATLFAGVPADRLTGEASVRYTDPHLAPVASARMREVVPNARLVYVVRHPIDRLRSHYRHDVQRGRERRPLAEAVEQPDNLYVAHSLYGRAYAPYRDAFPDNQLCVVRFEDLIDPDRPGWTQVLTHLGLSPRPLPTTADTPTRDKERFSPVARWLFERRWDRYLGKAPARVRTVGRSVLLRSSTDDESGAPIPDDVAAAIWRDVEQFERDLGVERPLWDRANE